MALAVCEWPAPLAGEAPRPLAGFESIHRVEGTALVLLCSTNVEVRRLGVELMRTARELHKTLASPPQPSSKRTTMQHPSEGGAASVPATAARRLSLQSRAGDAGGRRATTKHAAAASDAAAPGDSVPATPSGEHRSVYAADIVDKCAMCCSMLCCDVLWAVQVSCTPVPSLASDHAARLSAARSTAAGPSPPLQERARHRGALLLGFRALVRPLARVAAAARGPAHA